jgi:hypothetical protein
MTGSSGTEREAAMYQRVLTSLTITVAFSLAIFVQATSAKPISSQVLQQHPLVSEKVAGLNLGVHSAKPVNMPEGAYRALIIRSEALDQKYGVGAVNSAKPVNMSEGAYRTLAIRSKALDQKYGVGAVQSSKPLVSEKIGGLQLQPSSTQAEVVAGNGFDWSDAGIGAAFVFGTMLLGAGLLLTVRRHDFPVAS